MTNEMYVIVWSMLACLAVFKILDEIRDEGWRQLNLWLRRVLLSGFFGSFAFWLYLIFTTK